MMTQAENDDGAEAVQHTDGHGAGFLDKLHR